jgi:integrase/recombinase XerD
MIGVGMGKKDRFIPMSERALRWTDKYVAEARPALLTASDEGTVFLEHGVAFERLRLTTLVRSYIGKAKIGKTGGCHLFRRTVATLMLENGADIRAIQELPGHAKLSITELYTRVSIILLRQVYPATHPGASEKRAEEAAELPAQPDDEDDEES